MPAGIQPPVIVQYNASSVPVLQLSLSSDRMNEQQLYDYGIYRLRQALANLANRLESNAVMQIVKPH
jgi:multidrug efflux pump subunit AcrB